MTLYRECNDCDATGCLNMMGFDCPACDGRGFVLVEAVTIPLIGRCGCCDKTHRLDLPLPGAGNGDNE